MCVCACVRVCMCVCWCMSVHTSCWWCHWIWLTPSLLLPLSAIIEHTNKVLYLEDDDIAAVIGGRLSIHRLNRQAGEDPNRAILTLKMELQQIMKGEGEMPLLPNETD